MLAVCDFNMRFTFILAGWPGSIHDMRVFTDAMTKYGNMFPHPPTGKQLPMLQLQLLVQLVETYKLFHCVGNFYLMDSGYPNRPGYLRPTKEPSTIFRSIEKVWSHKVKKRCSTSHIHLLEMSSRGHLEF